MPNPVQATVESLPKFHYLLAAMSPMGTVAAAPISQDALAVDPLLDAVSAYQAGLADYNANAPEDDDDKANAYAEISWMPPFDALKDWTAPAITREGAMAALRLAIEEDENGDSPVVGPMIRAAVAYFEQEGAR